MDEQSQHPPNPFTRFDASTSVSLTLTVQILFSLAEQGVIPIEDCSELIGRAKTASLKHIDTIVNEQARADYVTEVERLFNEILTSDRLKKD